MRTFVLQFGRLIHSGTKKTVRIFSLSVALALVLSATLVPVPDVVVSQCPMCAQQEANLGIHKGKCNVSRPE